MSADLIERITKIAAAVDAWKKLPKEGRPESVGCPICGGTLRIGMAGPRGHARGICDTPDCVRFIE